MTGEHKPVVWESGAFQVAVYPELGATVAAVRWRRPDGQMIDLTRPEMPGAAAAGRTSDMSMFLLGPFTNRIDGGRIPTPEGDLLVPVNRPSEGNAIHGFLRTAVWTLDPVEADRMVLRTRHVGTDDPYAYDAVFSVVRTGEALAFTLALTNTAGRTLPFGIGLHPYFAPTQKMGVAFEAEGTFAVNPRLLPVDTLPVIPDGFGSGARVQPLDLDPFDLHFFHWRRTARVDWPEQGAAMTLTATPVLGNLHIFLPPDRSAVCLEPVSHVVDVVNRRQFATLGDLVPLAPGETLSGTMTLAPEPLAP